MPPRAWRHPGRSRPRNWPRDGRGVPRTGSEIVAKSGADSGPGPGSTGEATEGHLNLPYIVHLFQAGTCCVTFPHSRPRDLQPSGDLGVVADERDYVAESFAGGWGWVVDEFADGQSASSFCSTSSSRYGFAGLRLQLLLELVSLHLQLDCRMPTYCSMAAATAAARRGMPACCGRWRAAPAPGMAMWS